MEGDVEMGELCFWMLIRRLICLGRGSREGGGGRRRKSGDECHSPAVYVGRVDGDFESARLEFDVF